MTRAVRIHCHGGPEVLQWEEVPLADPGPGEVRLRHTAIGVNFIDTYHRSGLYPVPALPSGVGSEAAGVVEAVGAGVGLAVGERVAYAGGPPGAYAEHRVLAADRLVPLPSTISDQAAAATMLKGMTVQYLVRRVFPVAAGTTVLWHAAAGGVGLLACQWLRHLGATVIGTVGDDDKAELARRHGCDHPIVYSREDFVQRVRQLTGGAGVAVVFDGVGRSTFRGSLDCLSPRGMLVSFGNASGPPDPIDPLELGRRGSLFLTRPSLAHYTATRDELLATASDLFSVLESGALRPCIGQVWPLAEAAEAHRALEGRGTSGASLLVV